MKLFPVCLRVMLFIILFVSKMEAQERIDFTTVDSLYREDQFYFGLNINLLGDLPEGVSQSGFAGGIIGGFIRDLPLNKRRNVALGAGIGSQFFGGSSGAFGLSPTALGGIAGGLGGLLL